MLGMDGVAAPRTVVLVEDEALVRRALEALIRHSGDKVTAFADAASALRHLATHVADVLITDLEMPAMDGAALIAAVRVQGLACRCVLISGRARAHCLERLTALELAEVAVVEKPVSLAVMREILAG
jgi:CheY-like chemotaxis protein